MPVAYRLTGLFALEVLCRGQPAGAMQGRVASSVASFRWQRKLGDWHAIANLATTPAITSLGNSYRRVRETRS
jgi:hypothetical protein